MSAKEALAAFAIGVLVVGLGFGIWAFTVWFSPTKGGANVYKDQNSSSNREYWSARYNTDYQNVQADRDNLVPLHAAAMTPEAIAQDRDNYLGAQLNCRSDVATYNTDARNVLGGQWLPKGLPAQLNPSIYCGK